jgi:ABC-type Fe3+ transport system permease subunit
MDRLLKVLLIMFVVLILLVPIGLIASGTAYGEWSADELQQMVGYVPAGLSSLSGWWHAPFQEYSLQGLPNTFLGSCLGYYFSAILGVTLCAGAVLLLGKVITRHHAKNNE